MLISFSLSYLTNASSSKVFYLVILQYINGNRYACRVFDKGRYLCSLPNSFPYQTFPTIMSASTVYLFECKGKQLQIDSKSNGFCCNSLLIFRFYSKDYVECHLIVIESIVLDRADILLGPSVSQLI